MSDSKNYRVSYAGSDPILQRGIPAGLRREKPLKTTFDHARDPLISAQLKEMSKTEKQRREGKGRGSSMVRLHRPVPNLRPKHERSPLRAAFNQAWFKEQRAARMVQYKEAEKHVQKNCSRSYERER